MVFNAGHIAQDALAQLLERELPRAERERIKATARACEGVRAIHDLRTRYAGDRTFVEFHLEVDGSLSVDRGHLICEAAETAIRALLTGTVEVTAHLEPAGIDDDRLDARVRQQVA
jgi:divalent metal cation (Fe/Co/Zn/Cd) transporter